MSLCLASALAGCSQVEEIAGDAASQAAGAAADEVRAQVCRLVSDGVSAEDREVLGGLVDAAESAGLPAEFVDPLRDIAAAGDEVPEEAASQLDEACRPS